MDINLRLVILIVSLAACKALCNFEKFEYYSTAIRRCRKCDKCIQGEGTIEVKIQFSMKYGAMTCRPCRPCPGGFYNRKRAYRCRKCKDCQARGKYTIAPCTPTENAKCGGKILSSITSTSLPVEDVNKRMTLMEWTTIAEEILQDYREDEARNNAHVSAFVIPTVISCLPLIIFMMYKFRKKIFPAIRNCFKPRGITGVHYTCQSQSDIARLPNSSNDTDNVVNNSNENINPSSSNKCVSPPSLHSIHPFGSSSTEKIVYRRNSTESDIECDASTYPKRRSARLQSCTDTLLQPLIEQSKAESSRPQKQPETAEDRYQRFTELKEAIRRIVPHLTPPSKYKSLCRTLGVPDNALITIETDHRDNVQEQAYQSLTKWTHLYPEASVHLLQKGLILSGFADLMNKIVA